jgi:hypothetical protein
MYCRGLEITPGCSMKKKAKKESGETTRDSVKKEMAMSRIAESGREAASKATRRHDTQKRR